MILTTPRQKAWIESKVEQNQVDEESQCSSYTLRAFSLDLHQKKQKSKHSLMQARAAINRQTMKNQKIQ